MDTDLSLTDYVTGPLVEPIVVEVCVVVYNSRTASVSVADLGRTASFNIAR